MEGMTRSKWNAVESFIFKYLHCILNRFSFTSNDCHFRGIFVGCNDIPTLCFEDTLNVFIRSSYARHQSFVINFDRTHFSTACSSSSQCTIHIENTRNHQCSIFTKRMSCNHVRFVSVCVEGMFNGQICCKHCWLCVFSLLELVFCSFSLRITQTRP